MAGTTQAEGIGRTACSAAIVQHIIESSNSSTNPLPTIQIIDITAVEAVACPMEVSIT
jgi:hypothetical protein